MLFSVLHEARVVLLERHVEREVHRVAVEEPVRFVQVHQVLLQVRELLAHELLLLRTLVHATLHVVVVLVVLVLPA